MKIYNHVIARRVAENRRTVADAAEGLLKLEEWQVRQIQESIAHDLQTLAFHGYNGDGTRPGDRERKRQQQRARADAYRSAGMVRTKGGQWE